MFELLLAADPSFWPSWKAFCEEWSEEPELPQYVALFSLAEHLIAKLQTEDLANFNAIFDVVELWHTHGDQYVKEAATIGLLESLMDVPIEPWLKPVTKKWWDKLHRFWEGDAKALRDEI